MDHSLVVAKGLVYPNKTMSHAVTQDRQVMVKHSDKMWSMAGGNGKPLQYSWLENLMNSMKRQKDMRLEDELPRLEDVQYATGENQRALLIAPE